MITQLFRDWVTGQLKIERLANRQRAALYAGANPGNKRPSPQQLRSEEGYKNQGDRIRLIRAARELEEDFPIAEAILSDFETYVVGDCKYRSDTGNKDADKVINEHLEWRFDQIDYSNRFDLTKLARLAIRTQKRDGQCAWLPVFWGDELRINAVSGDRIGNPLLGGNSAPENFGGIIVNPTTGAPIKYEIYRRLQKRDQYQLQVTALARDIFHYYDPFRIEGYHGVTAFRTGIEHAYDAKQAIEFALLNMKFRASQLPSIRNQEGRARAKSTYDTTGVGGFGEPKEFEINIAGVRQSFLRLGEDFVDFPSDFPNQQFQPLMLELKRDICVGVKLPLEFVYQSQAGGVVQRFYADKAIQTFKEDKRWMRRTLLEPTKNRILQNDIENGSLDLRRFGDLADVISQARIRGTWHMGKEISVDYGREVDADIKLIDRGLMPSDDYIDFLGGDPEIVRNKIKAAAERVLEDAEEIAKARNLPVEVVLPLLQKKFENPLPPAPPPAEPGEPPPVVPQ